ncbi:hypothetical protein ZEAMMB73_Zm00001d018251 [Zea mays]|uniref:Knottin scorpion toxin-like domain-containing protein n=2 Tax=Zea mays TaxID=4577 RepID=A0A1D6HLU9_MAIZE|nr:hypothetical protein ZEAMMB73_Zm00001d018251 [Zea mays]
MRTRHLLLVATPLLLLLAVSSDLTAKVSARCPDPESVTLYPGKPCNRQQCKTDCASKYHGGVGVCLNPKGCYCEYCLDRPSAHAASPLRPRHD